VKIVAEIVLGLDWRCKLQEYRRLLESGPFVRSGYEETLQANHIWDICHPGTQHERLSRLMLMSAVLEAIREYKQGQADIEQELQEAIDHTKKALNRIDGIFSAIFQGRRSFSGSIATSRRQSYQ
jgi:hypothetical protein